MTLTGLHVPLITPFDGDGAVALDALASLARDLLDAGVTGLVALGTTAEPESLTEDERRAVLDTVGRVCRERRAPLTVGAHTAAALRGLADRTEVTAALTLVPPFVRPGEAGAVAHLAGLAAASPVPLIVYDIAPRTGQYLGAGSLRRLAAAPGIAGVKYAPGGINADTVALLAEPPAGFAVLGGDDPFVSPLLALGAHGAILATAHLVPDQFVGLVAAWRAGDVAAARAAGHRLAGLSAALLAEPNPTVIKAVLHARGRIPSPAVRPPLLPASAAAVAVATRRLDALGA